jgi:hypothetical protein
MSVAMGTGAVSGSVAGYTSRVCLDAEVARYRKELANCVNCPTSSTPEGKANIQEISNKISADQARIEQIEAGKAAAGENGYTSAGASATLMDPGKGNLLNVSA